MPNVNTILTEFRVALIAAGLVRAASDDSAPMAARPPMVIMPVDGAPAPGEDEDILDTGLVLSLIHGGDLSEATGYDAAQRRRSVIDIRYRSKLNADLREAMALDASIVSLLIKPETNYGYGFNLGGMFVHQAAIWGGFSPIGSSAGQGFDHVAKFLIEVQR